jgi:hypothetical protein
MIPSIPPTGGEGTGGAVTTGAAVVGGRVAGGNVVGGKVVVVVARMAAKKSSRASGEIVVVVSIGSP